VAILVGLFLLGWFVSRRAERSMARKDPGDIVIDEVVGQWATMLPFAHVMAWQLLPAFLLFRIFDMLKPWPIRTMERKVSGGLGVMIDDVVAAGFACVGMWMVNVTWKLFFT
jgi:phosphatidylglycerophosphatase A